MHHPVYGTILADAYYIIRRAPETRDKNVSISAAQQAAHHFSEFIQIIIIMYERRRGPPPPPVTRVKLKFRKRSCLIERFDGNF